MSAVLRPRRYLKIAGKYWRMNPLRLWWILHVWDEIRADRTR
jgi:hypothetical protein